MKKTIELIKELYKTPRGKGILFFLFYFILFLILILFLRFNNGNGTDSSLEYEKGTVDSFNFSSLANENYHFKYIVKLDAEEKIYEGDRFEDEEKFKYNGLEYYKNNDDYYVKETKWKKTDNPYLYPEFKDIEMISKVIDKAYLEYKTEYNSGQVKTNFLVSTNTLNEIINNRDTDIEEVPNSIIITTFDEEIYSINYNLDSYCINNKLCKKNLKIEIIYEEIDNIHKIKSPIT